MVPAPREMVTLEYLPTGISFASNRVCSPLKRAKSTEGVPLIIGTGVPPPWGLRSTLSIVTANETTDATVGGASVPTTKVEPVVVDVPELPINPLVQPATASTAVATGTSANLMSILHVLGDI